MRFLYVFIALLLISSSAVGQDIVTTNESDTILIEEATGIAGEIDTIRFQSKWPNHQPGKASLYSAILPGLGQAYNKSYWKIPIIYIGFGVFYYFISENNSSYQTGLECLREIRGPGVGEACAILTSGIPSEEQMESFVERSRRNRDYTIILGALFYGLQIVEAHVDAHLKEFSVNEDLALKFKPDFEMLSFGQPYAGVGIKLRFR